MTTMMAEPEWDEEARGWARALLWYDSGLCGCGCGFPAAVAQASENEDRFHSGDPVRCHARTAIEIRMKQLADGESSYPHALLVSAELLEAEGG